MSQQQPEAEPRANATLWIAALGATVLIQVVGSLAVAALPALGPPATRDAGLPPEAIGQIYGFGLLGSVIFLALGTPILALFGPVRTLQAGAVVAAIGTAAAGFLPLLLLAGRC